MLSTIGKAFFEVTSTSRQKGEFIPTVYLNIRHTDNSKMVGQMRFNLDELYSKANVRMAFNMINPEMVNPEKQEGSDFLEEVVVGGLCWAAMDNHHLFPKQVLPYMVVHDYDEDNKLSNIINGKIRKILRDFGCVETSNDIFVFDPKNGGKMLSDFLRSKS